MAANESYVIRKNISKVIQWITAEIIAAEPENPVAFIHELCGQHSKNADVNELLNKSIQNVSAAKLKLNLEDSALQRFESCIAQISRFKATDPLAIDHILSKITELTKAKSCVLHFINQEQRTITLNYGDEDHVIAIGEGLVGKVAETQIPMIKDEDPLTAELSGDKIQSTCASPLFNSGKEVIGVVQLINKEGEKSFTPQDLCMLSIFCSALTIFVCGSVGSQNSQADMTALVDLLETVRNIGPGCPLSSLIFTITRRTAEMIGTDRATLFVVDPIAQQMWSMQGEINIRIPINAGIAGTCATTGEIINIEDAYKDDRFNPAFDKKSGYHTTTILCIPMKLQTGQVVGVLQLINKFDGVFTDDDAKLLTIILDDAAPKFSSIGHFQKGSSGPEMPLEVLEVHKQSDASDQKQTSKNISAMLPLIEETEEEADDALL
jgi:adenylate cyclase